MCAPAVRYSRSWMADPSPAPRSTRTAWPWLVNSRVPSGVRATRFSPSFTSPGTPTIMSKRYRGTRCDMRTRNRSNTDRKLFLGSGAPLTSDRCRVSRLVQQHPDAARQHHRHERSESASLGRALELDALRGEIRDRGLKVVAHDRQLVG